MTLSQEKAIRRAFKFAMSLRRDLSHGDVSVDLMSPDGIGILARVTFYMTINGVKSARSREFGGRTTMRVIEGEERLAQQWIREIKGAL